MTLRFVRQIQTPSDLMPYHPSLLVLLKTHHSVLLDDVQRTGNVELDAQFLLENIADYMPWVWLLTDASATVWGIAALSDIQLGRHAFVHGVSHPALRESADIDRTVFPLTQTAFETLNLLKLKAEFEVNNSGARGFCLRLGFRREALFKADVQINGQHRDVTIYSLTAEVYRDKTRPVLIRRSQQSIVAQPVNRKETEPCH